MHTHIHKRTHTHTIKSKIGKKKSLAVFLKVSYLEKHLKLFAIGKSLFKYWQD